MGPMSTFIKKSTLFHPCYDHGHLLLLLLAAVPGPGLLPTEQRGPRSGAPALLKHRGRESDPCGTGTALHAQTSWAQVKRVFICHLGLGPYSGRPPKAEINKTKEKGMKGWLQ